MVFYLGNSPILDRNVGVHIFYWNWMKGMYRKEV